MESNLLHYRQGLKLAADTGLWAAVLIGAYILRLETGIIGYAETLLWVFLASLPVKFGIITYFGLYRQSWRNSSIRDFFNLGKAIALYTVLFFAAAIALRSEVLIPLSVPVIEAFLALVALGGIRILCRTFLSNFQFTGGKKKDRKRVLIAGAGESGTMIAREMLRHPESGMIPVAFLDDDPDKRKVSFLGLPVAGDISAMHEAILRFRVDELIIAMPSESGDAIRRVVDYARRAKIQHRIIPGIYELLSGKISINQLRKVDVEDLLRRDPVKLDENPIAQYLRNKRVLVTGAGGSIGSEIVRQVARFKPESITLLGRGENSIHEMAREMAREFSDIEYALRICDVRDMNSLEQVFKEHQPEVIFHAAAHKHVPLMERDPAQAVFNNIGGTRNLVNLALEFDVEFFVNISTDKAVNPTSVMGASKRIAEYVVRDGADRAKPGQHFVSVRFGNVLGSRGSVIPIFKEQIRRGGPITITDPEMIRYFMTIPEASQLVLQAGALKQNGSVFVLDMGEPVKIEDMARDLIRLSGLEPDVDIEIKYSGIRPGEKLYEELLTSEEGTNSTQYEKIMVARNGVTPPHFFEKLENLFTTAQNGNPEAIKTMICSIIPSYSGAKKEKVEEGS